MSKVDLICLFVFCTCVAKEPLKIELPDQGTIMGIEISVKRTKKIRAFLGIPYAVPPLNEYRLAPTVTEPLLRWEGVKNVSKYAPACLQTKDDFDAQDIPFLNLISDRNFEMDEDCLYLNVFSPLGKYFLSFMMHI